ncbi:MAG TPA: hypothetical protein DEB40_00135 [Elusimicrobia bacterium]|nr:hypothetical protein [Elusimicrobiota bacterium]HBT60141.1 hypothetical protein [Elusimicrobiota bacterium]
MGRRIWDRQPLLAACVVLGLFLLWQGFSLHSFLRTETRPPAWDQANHLDVAWEYRDALLQGDWGRVWNFVPKSDIPPFPPLYHLALASALSSGNQTWIVLWVNWVYLVLLSFSLLGIAWEMRREVSAAAAPLILAGTPIVLWLFYNQLPDLALTACAALAYWMLLRCAGFSRWPWALGFGGAFAFGMLHKWSFFSYLWPAYWLAFQAWRRRENRAQVLAAAALALALALPWYAVRFPLVLTRLVAASSDFAVPFWRQGAFFQYFRDMIPNLGIFFFALAWAGAFRPKVLRESAQARVLLAWVLSSYLFWAIVPNRQMRYLLPGLPGLAVLCWLAWPKRIIWGLAALQVLTAANFTRGWIKPVSLPAPLGLVQFFPQGMPRREDWRIEEILREASGRSRTDLVLAANHPFFNELNFIWTARRLGLDSVRLSGPGASLWELSDLVLLKEGDLGPAAVTAGLPEISAEMNRPGGWFEAAYGEAKRWPLPDGSAAVLFEKKKYLQRPFPARALNMDRLDAGALAMSGLRVMFGDWDPKASVFRRVSLSAKEALWRGLRVRDLRLDLEDALPWPESRDLERGRWRLLKLGRVRIAAASVSAGDLELLLLNRGVRARRLELEGGLRLDASYRGLPVSIKAGLEQADSGEFLRLGVSEFRLGGVSLPAERMVRFFLGAPLLAARRLGRSTAIETALHPGEPKILPFAVDLAGFSFHSGRMTVP